MTFLNDLTRQLQIQYPIIMAPMFLVSNEEMMVEAMRNGIMGTFPSLNYRKDDELESLLFRLNEFKKTEGVTGSYGVNLIVQQTNPLYRKHLQACITAEVPFYITSLGNPKEVIEAAHAYGGKVYCDVTNLKHAQKCMQLGCDGFIAVGAGAGGHAGPVALHVLVQSLKQHFPSTPIVAAGGIASGSQIASMLMLGAQGVSIGTRFIASQEAMVAKEYKDAILQAGMDDIVMTERISGTPCAIINTAYAKKIGYRQNWLERQLNTNKTVKKYFKMLVQIQGMRKLEKSVHPGNYNNLWSAGQSVEFITDVKTTQQIITDLMNETRESVRAMNELVKA